MKKKLLIGLITLISLMALVSATIYTEPWNSDQDGGNKTLSNMFNVSSQYFYGSFIGNIFGNISGNVAWSNLTDYPSACPGSSAITTLGDSVTCSDLWVDVSGDKMTGNLTFSNSGILNLSLIQSRNWTNVTITESQISDLQDYLINGTNVNLLNINASSATIHGNLNVTGVSYLGNIIISADNITVDNIIPLSGGDISLNGNLSIYDKITFRLGEIIDNLANGWIRITGGLNVTDNLNVGGNTTIGNLIIGGSVTGLDNKTTLSCNNITGSSGALCSNQTAAANAYSDLTFIVKANESNLNVNSSIFSNSSTNWGNLNSINSTQMENNAGVLNIVLSWLNGLFYQKSEVYNKTEIDNSLITNYSYINNETFNYNQTTPAIDYANSNFYNKSADINTGSYNISSDDFIGKIFYFQNSTGTIKWKMYVNDSGSLITESI